MKGQSKRFVDHRGKRYCLPFRGKTRDEGEDNDDVEKSVGFLSLWRYASASERSLTALSVVLSLVSSCGVAAAVLVYGEVTSLFVSRTREEAPSAGSTVLLSLFGGARTLANNSTTSEHMSALIEDSVAFALASIAVMGVQFISASSAVCIANISAERMVSRLRISLLKATLQQEMAFFDTNKTLNFAAMLTESMDALHKAVGAQVPQTCYLLGASLALAALALASGWKLALAGLGLVPVVLATSATVAHYQSVYSAQEVSTRAAAGRVVQESLTNAGTVRAYRAERLETERFSSALSLVHPWRIRRTIITALGGGASALLAGLVNALVLAMGARLVARDLLLPPEEREYDPGVCVIVLFCTFMSAQNISMCAPHLELFASARGAASGMYMLLERRPRAPAGQTGGVKPAAFRGDIEFDNVYFNYPSRPETKVLRGFSLKVSAGDCVCLVGGSGCGKSTSLQLLQALYRPLSGHITVDGYPLEALDTQHFRQHIGIVGQEPVLFSGTIRFNLTLGATREYTQKEIEDAAKIANAHEFIVKLPQGYDTELAGGGALSGGQRQRLALARALLRQPSILLLDEPTAALDARSEALVQAALEAASVGRTTIMITHRMSAVPAGARVVLVEQGAVREEAVHGERLPPSEPVTKSLNDEEDKVEPQQFTRAYTKQDSFKVADSVRSSVRSTVSLASLHSPVHLPRTYTEPIIEEDVEEKESNDEVPSVSFWQLLKLQKEERWLLLGGSVGALLVGASMPAFAYLFSQLYGMFTWSNPADIVHYSTVYASMFVAIAVAAGLAAAAQHYLLAAAGDRLTDRLTVATAHNYLLQEQAWLSLPQNSVGALCGRLARDSSAAQQATGSQLGTIVQGASTLLLGALLAAAYSWKMTAASLCALPFVVGAIWWEGVESRRAEADASRGDVTHAATEAVIHARTVHTLGVSEALVARAAAAAAGRAGTRSGRAGTGCGRAGRGGGCGGRAGTRSGRAGTGCGRAGRGGGCGGRAGWARGAAYGACVCAPTLGYCVSLAVGGYLIAQDNMPLHYAILVSEALIYGAWMVAEALALAPDRARAARIAARVLADLYRQPAIRSEPGAMHDPNWRARGAIEFRDVHFSYGGTGKGGVRGGVRGVSLTVPAGGAAALVGRSGSGKSTLLKLLLREEQPLRGDIFLDGINIRTGLSLPTLRAQFATVQQEPVLFSRSLLHNVAYGESGKDASVSDVIAATRMTDMHEFVMALPQGYDTIVSGSAASMSGGQRQRVCVSRAVLRAPPVLLLDEPTAALDARSEQSVLQALRAARAAADGSTRTTVCVAHRLSTITHVDTIYVLHDGRIVESGSHAELLARRGHYHALWMSQDDHGDTGHGNDIDTHAEHRAESDTGHGNDTDTHVSQGAESNTYMGYRIDNTGGHNNDTMLHGSETDTHVSYGAESDNHVGYRTDNTGGHNNDTMLHGDDIDAIHNRDHEAESSTHMGYTTDNTGGHENDTMLHGNDTDTHISHGADSDTRTENTGVHGCNTPVDVNDIDAVHKEDSSRILRNDINNIHRNDIPGNKAENVNGYGGCDINNSFGSNTNTINGVDNNQIHNNDTINKHIHRNDISQIHGDDIRDKDRRKEEE